MITIDSQIWIYFFDPNAPENENVRLWMNKNLQSSEIILSTIIPLEVAHNLYTIPKLSSITIEKLLFKWITQKNIKIADVSHREMVNALQMLKSLRPRRIGGRDCLILATMDLHNVGILVTNDKKLLNLDQYKRVIPIFNPPIIMEKK